MAHIHEGSNTEVEQNVMELHNLKEFGMESVSSPGLHEDRDRTIMRCAAQVRTGVHSIARYVCNEKAESIRLGENDDYGNPEYRLISNELLSSCGLCGQIGNRVNSCPLHEFG